mmetsp:Transcript_73664/g.196286  ORF Transcript_73664/g.196286 Transcript_73664/m.196286 type:complete len:209 (+) Transcript_73664:2922-3548(+)
MRVPRGLVVRRAPCILKTNCHSQVDQTQRAAQFSLIHKQNIVHLQISVNDLLQVQICQSRTHLTDYNPRLVFAQLFLSSGVRPSLVCQKSAKMGSRTKLHHDVPAVKIFKNRVNSDNVRVVDHAQNIHLALKDGVISYTQSLLFTTLGLSGDFLHRAHCCCRLVQRSEHRPKRASAQVVTNIKKITDDTCRLGHSTITSKQNRTRARI